MIHHRIIQACSIVLFLALGSEHANELIPQSSQVPSKNVKLRAANPAGVNIPGISQAMIVENGKLVFDNLNASLKAAGAQFRDVARLTIYVRDYQSNLLPLIRKVRDRYVNTNQPSASALIGVATLFHPDVQVEINAVAVIASSKISMPLQKMPVAPYNRQLQRYLCHYNNFIAARMNAMS